MGVWEEEQEDDHRRRRLLVVESLRHQHQHSLGIHCRVSSFGSGRGSPPRVAASGRFGKAAIRLPGAASPRRCSSTRRCTSSGSARVVVSPSPSYSPAAMADRIERMEAAAREEREEERANVFQDYLFLGFLALALHRHVEAFDVDGHALGTKGVLGQVKGKAVSVIELERGLAIELATFAHIAGRVV